MRKGPPIRLLESITLKRSRDLRRESTDAERRLWAALRNRQFFGAKFRRQVAIGRFIVDFCCTERQLVVELDGGQHAMQQRYDRLRTRELIIAGFRVLRFWNAEVLRNTEGVLEDVARALNEDLPAPSP
jgi:very-short-patch-repair endonuclease